MTFPKSPTCARLIGVLVASLFAFVCRPTAGKLHVGTECCEHYDGERKACDDLYECRSYYFGTQQHPDCYQIVESFRCPLDGYNPGYVPSDYALGKTSVPPMAGVRKQPESAAAAGAARSKPGLRERANKVANVEELVELEKARKTPKDMVYVGLLDDQLGKGFYNAYDVYGLELVTPRKGKRRQQPKKIKFFASFFRKKETQEQNTLAADYGTNIEAADSVRVRVVASFVNDGWRIAPEDVVSVEVENNKQMTTLHRNGKEATNFAWTIRTPVEKEFKEFLSTAVEGE